MEGCAQGRHGTSREAGGALLDTARGEQSCENWRQRVLSLRSQRVPRPVRRNHERCVAVFQGGPTGGGLEAAVDPLLFNEPVRCSAHRYVPSAKIRPNVPHGPSSMLLLTRGPTARARYRER